MEPKTADSLVARVFLLDAPYQIDKLYDYYIPEPLRGEVEVGGFVVVPFGSGSRRMIALVFELAQSSGFSALKPIQCKINPELVLNEEQMGLCRFLKEHTFCTIGDAVRAMLPTTAFSTLMMTWTVEEEARDKLERKSTEWAMIYQYIASLKNAAESRLIQRFGNDILQKLQDMEREGLVRRVPKGRGTEEKTDALYRLAASEEEVTRRLETASLRGAKQIEMLKLLLENGSMLGADLRMRGITTATSRTLVRMGLVEEHILPTLRDPFSDLPDTIPDHSPLTEEQQAAFDRIRALLDTGMPKAALLFGVTGSGKTRVMKAVIDEVIRRGKSVILLVPEIALTPQTVGFFRAYYRDRIALIHSMLSAGERYDAWRRMRDGEIDLCIGTRSAVFAPLSNLGAILIDEEQEHTYKSDSAPKYHAIDVARYRCAYHNALMLPASATPSIESFYKARKGIYSLITLENRYGGATLPSVETADLRQDVSEGNLSPIGSVLRERLEGVLAKKEQAILFVNRRGYHRFLTCPTCGHVVCCPNCTVSLTHHAKGAGDVGDMRCHYCGHREPVPSACPACKAEGIRRVGFGTQKAEEELVNLFPQARIMRMDADTTAGKAAYRNILDRFRAGDADFLVGTQMVTKGHDFPRVTLVGVLNADGAMYLDDYRAAERSFSLLTQVIGRAGRGEKPGEAIIQTMSPHHPLLTPVKKQDYLSFYEEEIAIRQALIFPPCCELVAITLSGKEEIEVLKVCETVGKRLKELAAAYTDVQYQLFGPMEAPIYRLNEVFRMRFVLKCRLNSRTRALLAELLVSIGASFGRRVSIVYDINPGSV